MHRYLILAVLLMLLSQALATEAPVARIATRSYQAQELAAGFEAYLDYKEVAGTLSAADSLQLYRQYFDELIAMYVYQSAISSGKVEISIQELEAEIRKHPPQGVQSIVDLHTDGQFDPKKYERALRDKPAFKQEIMDFSREIYSYRKLLDSIKAEAQVDADSLRRAWLDTAQSADARIIYFDYTRFKDLIASEDEVLALYEEVKDSEFKKYDGRSLTYVRFGGLSSRATASAELQRQILIDSQKLYSLAQELGFVEAATQMALQWQASPIFTRSDLFIRGLGREPMLIEAGFTNPVGTVLEPHQGLMGDTFVCEVALSVDSFYEEFRSLKPVLQYRANSLKRIQRNREFVQEYIRTYQPSSYLEAALQDSIPILNESEISMRSSISSLGEVEALNLAILNTLEGEFTPLIEHNGMYYLAYVTVRHLRSAQDWEAQKTELMATALQQAQNEHLDTWYRAEVDSLDILWPEALQK